jgi:nucleolar protein 53
MVKKSLKREQVQRESTKRRKELKAKRAMKLSKHKFEAMPGEVKLSDEIPTTLRELVPEGNLLLDRFKSFQQRNMIEPRKPVSARRRYRLKEYEKHSYKDFK